MNSIKKAVAILLVGLVIVIIAGVMLISCTPGGVAVGNMYVGIIEEVNNKTSYETKKKVEDSCRSMIVAYEADKLMYEQYKDSSSAEERGWASSAKIRANKTAIQYNEYILKNSYVWDKNIPSDINEKLEIISN